MSFARAVTMLALNDTASMAPRTSSGCPSYTPTPTLRMSWSMASTANVADRVASVRPEVRLTALVWAW